MAPASGLEAAGDACDFAMPLDSAPLFLTPTFGDNACETGVVLGRSPVVVGVPSLTMLGGIVSFICGPVFATLTAGNFSATLVGAAPAGFQLAARPSRKPKPRLAPINRPRLAKNMTAAVRARVRRACTSAAPIVTGCCPVSKFVIPRRRSSGCQYRTMTDIA